eukprot:6479965-Amphidinium_carterae.1
MRKEADPRVDQQEQREMDAEMGPEYVEADNPEAQELWTGIKKLKPDLSDADYRYGTKRKWCMSDLKADLELFQKRAATTTTTTATTATEPASGSGSQPGGELPSSELPVDLEMHTRVEKRPGDGEEELEAKSARLGAVEQEPVQPPAEKWLRQHARFLKPEHVLHRYLPDDCKHAHADQDVVL